MIKILALDGGGARAYFQALLAADLEAETGQPIHELFDLIVGTSGGGLNALAFVHPDKPSADDITDFWFRSLDSIFKRRWWRLGVSGPRYSSKALREALTAFFGAKKMTDATAKVMVTGYKLAEMAPILITTASDWPMVDAGLATSAAPTYFPPARGTADGGLYANNPADLGIAYALEIAQCRREDILLVSIGTGQYLRATDPAKAAKWGFLGWGQNLIKIVFDGQSDITHTKAKWLLGLDRYFRFDPPLVGVDLDDTSQRARYELERMAHDVTTFRSRDFEAVCNLLTQQ